MTKLKQRRLATGLSQSQLAKKAGLNVRILQHYEQGSRNFDHAKLEVLLKYCLALDCKLSDLIEDAECLKLLKQYE